jgi:hypothetical protein
LVAASEPSIPTHWLKSFITVSSGALLGVHWLVAACANDRNRAQNSAQNPRAMIGVSNIAMMMHFIVLAKGFVLSAS